MSVPKKKLILDITEALCAERDYGEVSASDIAEAVEAQGGEVSFKTIGEVMFELPFIRTGASTYALADLSLRKARKAGVDQKRVVKVAPENGPPKIGVECPECGRLYSVQESRCGFVCEYCSAEELDTANSGALQYLGTPDSIATGILLGTHVEAGPQEAREQEEEVEAPAREIHIVPNDLGFLVTECIAGQPGACVQAKSYKQAISKARLINRHNAPVLQKLGDEWVDTYVEPRRFRGEMPKPGGLSWNRINMTNWFAIVGGESYFIRRSSRRRIYTLILPSGEQELYNSMHAAQTRAAGGLDVITTIG